MKARDAGSPIAINGSLPSFARFRRRKRDTGTTDLHWVECVRNTASDCQQHNSPVNTGDPTGGPA
jgi:hypothetical protein